MRTPSPLAIGGAIAVAITVVAAGWAARSCGTVAPAPGPGERLYRAGVLPSGAPARATVMGDVPMEGAQVACASCHGWSGMGTGEAGRRTPPVAGPLLFAPEPRSGRPAYDDATVARALLHGIDATGAPLDPLMPRYALGDTEVEALVAYLRQLGAAPSPGVEPEVLHLATVIAGDVPAAERDAVLEVLGAFVEAKNADVRREADRAKARREDGRALEPYRRWELHPYLLPGDGSSWDAALQQQYDAQPAFAVVGGVAAGGWGPIHTFCERNAVPCLLPSTDQPPPVGSDRYSLYFSGGLAVEGAAAAAAFPPGTAVQLVLRGDDRAAELAAAFTATWTARGGVETTIAVSGPSDPAVVEALGGPADLVAVWLADPGALPAVERGPTLVLSGTLTDRRWDGLPAALRPRTRAVDRFRAPDEPDPARTRFRAWAAAHQLAVADSDALARLQAQTWFACVALLDASGHVARYPQREYLLDTLDHAAGLSAFVPVYPRASFGPGQRLLSKGANLLDLSGDSAPTWTVP